MKVCDTVDHGILRNKVESYGIKRNILNRFKNYLSYISQYVEYNSERRYIYTL